MIGKVAIPFIKSSFISGEIAPGVFGRTDIDKFASAASTMRNMFVSYRGGAYSRAGTGFAGYSKQTQGSGYAGGGAPGAPRLIPFQFSAQQGLALEFGNEYMRVISNGAYVTESAVNITGISKANPAQISAAASGISTATANNSGVIQSYAPGDQVTLAGGSGSPAVLGVTNTTLLGLGVGQPGSGYVPNDTIDLGGGAQTSPAQATVTTTQISGLPGIVSPGTGGSPGTQTVTGTTGTGTPFQANVTITGTESASPNTGAVVSSYAPGDTVTLAGGTFTVPAELSVTSTSIIALTDTAPGTKYAPGDTITLTGGTTTLAPVATVATTKVVGTPTIAAAGTGGTTGTQTVTGTTGTGTKFQASVTVASGGISAVLSVTVAGSYTVNPTTLTAEPVTGGGLTGAQLSIVMGVNTITFTAGGNFTANPASNLLTQIATSGSGTGATFTGLFAPAVMAYVTAGNYTAFPSNPVAQGATSGTGYGVTFNVSNSSGITAVNSVTFAGAYTVNPTTLSAEPVTGAGLSGATLSIVMGTGTLSISEAGVFTQNPAGGVMNQASTSGSGTGVTLQNGLFGPNTVSVVSPGSYSTPPSNPVAQASTTGSGLGATFNLTHGSITAYNDGDWVYLSGIGGMTELNGRTVIVGGATTGGFYIYDVFGNPIDSTAYSSFTAGGTAARLYTLVTPWAEADLPWLKFTQSADVMSFTCWNQETLAEYPPYDLSRFADNDWTVVQTAIQTTIQSPIIKSLTGGGNDDVQSGTAAFEIVYYVTAVDASTNEESLPSIYMIIGNYELGVPGVDGTSARNIFTWYPVAGASYYNIYAETPVPFNPSIIVITQPTFAAGFIGQTFSTMFTDPGITPDFAKGLPQGTNPFAPGQIIATTLTSAGANYMSPELQQNSPITSATGVGGAIVASIDTIDKNVGSLIILNPGYNYAPGDTVAIGGSGTGATATLTIGPTSGTYPGTVAYFQERRVYANSQNNPDTYWMSQTGLYLNFDTHFPSVADDAITGSPWSVEVNGIQWMINMPGGLVVLTGLNAWQLTGSGGSSLNPVPITPSSEQAQPQAYNGCSPTVPPIKIDWQILYVQAKGSIYREFSYQIFQNNYQGEDLTTLSSHLFTGYTILEHAWCEEPYKILWSVRDDGALLSLTYVKPENVSSWSRHDTQGSFISVCSVTEPPVDALYCVVQRQTPEGTAYFVERMDNRIWNNVEDCWCVDAGLELGANYPNAFLTVSSATGLGALTGVTDLVGGTNYGANAYAVVTDNDGNGPGTGAVVALTINAGVIVAVNFTSQGTGYINPAISFVDPAATGYGASAAAILNNAAICTTSVPAFGSGNVGDIIRAAGGVMEITAFTSSVEVQVNILVPLTDTIPNTAGIVPSQYPGVWTMDTPTSTIGGLFHLIGMTVTGIADGNVITPRIVAADGSITLDTAATRVIVGLGFTAQLQSIYAEYDQPTMQGRRKKMAAVTARIEASKGLSIGSNQTDGSTLSPPQLAPAWQNMVTVPDLGEMPYNGLTVPLYTGDVRIPLIGGFATAGQIAIEQSNPLPMNVLAFVPEIEAGDVPQTGAGGGAQPQGGR